MNQVLFLSEFMSYPDVVHLFSFLRKYLKRKIDNLKNTSSQKEL